MQRILLIDNYDSFTFNLVQILRESALCSFEVVYNDAISVNDCKDFDKILISPGPGLPDEAGITCDVIRRWASEKSIFGVCLGHQAIGVVFGATLKKLSFPKHGTSEQVIVFEPKSDIFRDFPDKFAAGHYHSWVLSNDNFPSVLKISASDTEGNIMAISHNNFNLYGVQFHPESIMTDLGRKMIHNFLCIKTQVSY